MPPEVDDVRLFISMFSHYEIASTAVENVLCYWWAPLHIKIRSHVFWFGWTLRQWTH